MPAKKTAKKVPAKKAAKKATKNIKLRVRNPNFGKKQKEDENLKKEDEKLDKDCCMAATERELTDYERGVLEGIRTQKRDSMDGDAQLLNNLQSTLEDQEQGYSSARQAMLHNKSRMLEFESSIVQIRANIVRTQKRLHGRLGLAMRPI